MPIQLPEKYPEYLESSYPFPFFYPVQQTLPAPKLKNPNQKIIEKLPSLLQQNGIQAGDKVAISVGSRGIRNLPEIVHAIVKTVKDIGALPTIVPAMGSHGNATEEGQKTVLQKLGIDEDTMQCPVEASMEVVSLGHVFGEVPVYFSKTAFEMDHTIVFNRIKPHTKFKGPLESGIFKMLTVGMGKHKGAIVYHRWALKYGFYPLLEAIGRRIMKQVNFRLGIAVVENCYDETMEIAFLPKKNLLQEEQRLLTKAQNNMPTLPVSQTDVLIVGEIGKEISGAGMDPNITGRAYDLKEDDFSSLFHARRIAILNLSRKSEGNAVGLGNADLITTKVFEQLNYSATIINALTGVSLRKAAIPVILPNDAKAIQACCTTIGPKEPKEVKVFLIKNTLELSHFWVSEAVLPEIKNHANIRIGEAFRLSFGEDGNLSALPGSNFFFKKGREVLANQRLGLLKEGS